MSTCPHMTHPKPKPVLWDDLPISFCRDGCARTFSLCPHCGQEANHPLARYCRRCGMPVSFDKLARDYESGFYLNNVLGDNYHYSLSRYGINEVQSLTAYQSYLFVAAPHCVLIYDIHDLSEPLDQLRL